MKKMFFLFFLLVFLLGLQIITSSTNQIYSFHSKEERKILHWIEKNYQVWDGNLDENMGSRPKAIYSVTLKRGYRRFIVLAREKKTNHDFLLMIDPRLEAIEHRLSLSPYYCINQSDDFRGLLDLNNDNNLEMVCVVNGEAGKRVKIVKLSTLALLDLSFPFLESYGTIQLEDENIDGIVDIIAYQIENGLSQPPMIFNLQEQRIVKQELKNYPTLIRQYERYLQGVKKRTASAGNPSISLDLQIAWAKLYLALGQEQSFDRLNSQMNEFKNHPDITQKIRLYRMKILKAYFLWGSGEEKEAFRLMEEALDYLSPTGMQTKSRRSMLEVEKASFYLLTWDWDQALLAVKQALFIDPANAMAQKLHRDMGCP